MGNVCCRRKTTEPKEQSAELQFYRTTDTLQLKDAQDLVFKRQKKGEITTIEKYLYDVYVKECTIKASQEEVDLIQTGIEAIVQKIFDLVLDFIFLNETFERYLKIRNNESQTDKEIRQFQTSLIEVYFPVKTGKQYVNVKAAGSRIIKVGSFYEGTKNNFPDEFDFIFPLFYLENQPHFTFLECELSYEYILTTCIEQITIKYKESLKYVSPGKGNLYFDKYVMEHGPASMLQFVYSNDSGWKRNINVDLVPACKVLIDDDKRNWLKQVLKPKSFNKEVLSAGKCLNVNGFTSFTETEVHFIKNVLSQKHVKVYRILKFLINGHDDAETLKQYFRLVAGKNEIGYSSYQIKTMMIYHHDECMNPDTDDLGPCILQVLEEMCQYDRNDNFASVIRFGSFNHSAGRRFCLLSYLLSLTQTFKSMQISKESYDYEMVRMKSLSRQYLDDLNRNDRKHAVWFKYLDTLSGVDPSQSRLMEYLAAEKCAGLESF